MLSLLWLSSDICNYVGWEGQGRVGHCTGRLVLQLQLRRPGLPGMSSWFSGCAATIQGSNWFCCLNFGWHTNTSLITFTCQDKQRKKVQKAPIEETTLQRLTQTQTALCLHAATQHGIFLCCAQNSMEHDSSQSNSV